MNNAYIRQGTMDHDVVTGFWVDAGESIEVYNEVIAQVRTHRASAAPHQPV